MKYYLLILPILFVIGFLLCDVHKVAAKQETSMFGIFDNNEPEISDWRVLNSQDQISEIIKLSRTKPILIYKHSTACGISQMAKSRLENDWAEVKDKVILYYLDLLAFRDVSDQVARIFNIKHQSPQIILIVDGRAVFSWSHYEVNIKSVLPKLEK